jgi:hypothetical protein
MNHLAVTGLLFAMCASLGACTTAPSDSSRGPTTGMAGKADGVGSDGILAMSRCVLMYYSDQCGTGPCANAEIARIAQSSDGAYPALSQPVGTTDLPYWCYVATAPKWVGSGPLTDDGYFDLEIHDREGTSLAIGSEAEVSLARLATDHYVEAGDLRAKVTPFSYQGQVFNNLELNCYLSAN